MRQRLMRRRQRDGHEGEDRAHRGLKRGAFSAEPERNEVFNNLDSRASH